MHPPIVRPRFTARLSTMLLGFNADRFIGSHKHADRFIDRRKDMDQFIVLRS